jgi:hypothetical protein
MAAWQFGSERVAAIGGLIRSASSRRVNVVDGVSASVKLSDNLGASAFEDSNVAAPGTGALHRRSRSDSGGKPAMNRPMRFRLTLPEPKGRTALAFPDKAPVNTPGP